MRAKAVSHRDNQKGIILLTVIMMTIVLSMVVVGFLSSTVSQVKSSQSVLDRVKAEALALGTFYQYHQIRLEPANGATLPPSQSLDGKVFTINAPAVVPNSPINNTSRVTVPVSY